MRKRIHINNHQNIFGTSENLLDLKRKRIEQSLEKAFESSKIVHLKSNDNFDKFYNELRRYMSNHYFPVSINRLCYLSNEEEFGFMTDNKVCMSEDVIEIYEEDICKIKFIPHDKGIELFRLEMYRTGKGLGSSFMNAFMKISALTGVAIFLTPGIPGFNTTGDQKKLYKFYSRFNFKKIDRSKYWSNCYFNGKIRPYNINN